MFKSKKYPINIVLSLIAMAIAVYYAACDTACSHLGGTVAGLDLHYVGIAFMVILVLLNIFKMDTAILLLLSAGFGVEIFLTGFQVKNDTYCPYCLAFGALLILQFILNLQRERGRIIITALAATAGFLGFLTFFEGSPTPTYDYASALGLVVFGFCVPCGSKPDRPFKEDASRP